MNNSIHRLPQCNAKSIGKRQTKPSKPQQAPSAKSRPGDNTISGEHLSFPKEEPEKPSPAKGLGKLGTVDDLAKRWSLRPKTIRNNLSSGRLKLGSKILGRHRFDIEEVRAYESENRIAAKDAVAPVKPIRGGAK